MKSGIKSKRTKRVKLNQELNDIQRMYSVGNNNAEFNLENFETEVITPFLSNILEFPSTSSNICSDGSSQYEQRFEPLEKNTCCSKTSFVTSSLMNLSETQSSTIENLDNSSNNSEPTNQEHVMVKANFTTFKDDLISWSIECNVPQSTINSL